MTDINRSVLLPYSAKQLYDLINDIEAYPEFMEGCIRAQVLHRTEDLVEARLTLSKGGIKHSFATRNRLLDARHISLELVEGPFSFFEGGWEFQPLSDSACKITLNLSFNVNNAVLGAAAARLFEGVTNNLVGAVEKRAKQLYG